MVTISLSEQDLLRLQMIDVDRNAEDALKFIKERVMPQVKEQQAKMIVNRFDSGMGSSK